MSKQAEGTKDCWASTLHALAYKHNQHWGCRGSVWAANQHGKNPGYGGETTACGATACLVLSMA